MKIAIQGNPGSFHEQAVWQFIQSVGRAADIIYQETFSDVFASVRDGSCDGAMVAIANNSVGFIHDPYRTLVRDVGNIYRITGETYVRVEHHLLGTPGTKLADITHVHSQAPALGQCEDFLQSVLPHAHREEESDTALSAQLVARHGKKTHAAIASRRAGELNGLVTLAENIQDDAENITRFLYVVHAKQSAINEYANKLTAILTMPERPGSLAAALSIIAEESINITSLQSLFIPNSPFRMQFWMDISISENDQRFSGIREKLENMGCNCSVLGSYIEENVRDILSRSENYHAK